MAESSYEDFTALELRVGTVREVRPNPKARVPAYVLTLDFGSFGVKTSSAQLTENYQPEDLIGRQIVAVTNLPPKRVAGVKSEVLVLGAMDPELGVVLLEPRAGVPDGTRIL